MKATSSVPLLICALIPLAGCQQIRPPDMTLHRGAQLLAAGSPKSAIPFLSQTVASTPDGPEPIALLSLAYALDMQPERAIAQAQQIRPQTPPGWHFVAMAVAWMLQGSPADAGPNLERVLQTCDPASATAQSAAQWMALAQLLAGHDAAALETLRDLGDLEPMRTTALLWTVLIHARYARAAEASQALAQCAGGIAGDVQPVPDGSLAGQALYDNALAAIVVSDFGSARSQLRRLLEQEGEGGDAPVWLALLEAADGDWPATRSRLIEAQGLGSPQSRGLANQLFSVVCALESRPDAMIEHMLAGQRLLGRHTAPTYVVEQPKPEPVWFSDSMK